MNYYKIEYNVVDGFKKSLLIKTKISSKRYNTGENFINRLVRDKVLREEESKNVDKIRVISKEEFYE